MQTGVASKGALKESLAIGTYGYAYGAQTFVKNEIALVSVVISAAERAQAQPGPARSCEQSPRP